MIRVHPATYDRFKAVADGFTFVAYTVESFGNPPSDFIHVYASDSGGGVVADAQGYAGADFADEATLTHDFRRAVRVEPGEIFIT